MLQYIISGNNASNIISTASKAIDNGCRWLRIDISNLSNDDAATAVSTIQAKCVTCDAMLSIEDNISMATKLKTSGVHLSECQPGSLVEARKSLGEEPVMGVTIHSAAQVPFLPRTAIDYIATSESQLDELSKIVEQMRATGLDEPVVATYSLNTSIEDIMATGIDGIAVHHTAISPSQLQHILESLTTIVEQRLSNI